MSSDAALDAALAVVGDAITKPALTTRRVLSSVDHGFPESMGDCSEPLQVMLDKARDVDGAEIVVDGRYTCRPFTLPDNCALTGTRNASLGGTGSPLVNLGSHSEIRDIQLSATGPGSRVVNVLAGASHSAIRRVTFDSPGSHSVYADTGGIHNLTVESCHFVAGAYGVLINQNAADFRVGSIRNNIFEPGFTSDPIALNFPHGKWIVDGRGGCDIAIVGNYITCSKTSSSPSSGFGISIAGARNVVVSNNRIVGARLQGIHVEDLSTNITIANNVIDGTGGGAVTSGLHGIHVLSFSTALTITGNVISNTAQAGIDFGYTVTTAAGVAVIIGNMVTGAETVGISVAGNKQPALPLQNIIIASNIVLGAKSHGINISGNAGNYKVSGNICDANGGFGIRVGGGKKGYTLTDNTLTGNAAGDVLIV